MNTKVLIFRAIMVLYNSLFKKKRKCKFIRKKGLPSIIAFTTFMPNPETNSSPLIPFFRFFVCMAKYLPLHDQIDFHST